MVKMVANRRVQPSFAFKFGQIHPKRSSSITQVYRPPRSGWRSSRGQQPNTSERLRRRRPSPWLPSRPPTRNAILPPCRCGGLLGSSPLCSRTKYEARGEPASNAGFAKNGAKAAAASAPEGRDPRHGSTLWSGRRDENHVPVLHPPRPLQSNQECPPGPIDAAKGGHPRCGLNVNG